MEIAIFGNKQQLLILNMKTKVVQHVSRIIFNVFKVFKVFRFPGFQVRVLLLRMSQKNHCSFRL